MKHFYFPFYPDRFIVGTVGFSPTEVGSYIKLLCYQFDKGSIPYKDVDNIRIITGFDGDLKRVLGKFPGGRNKTMLDVQEYLASKSKKARRSANKRWQCERNTNAMLSKSKSKSKSKLLNINNKSKEKTPAKAGTPQAEFVDNWSKLYQSETGKLFKADQKDYILIAQLLKRFEFPEVLSRAKLLFELCQKRSAWFTKGGMADFTIGKLSSQWNSLIKGVDDGKQAGLSQSEIEKFMHGRK